MHLKKVENTFQTNSFMTGLHNSRGMALLPVLGLSFVVIAIIMMSFMYFDSQRQQVRYKILRDTRKALVQEIESTLTSNYVLQHSITYHNTSGQNPLFVQCVEAVDPSSCDEDLGIYVILPSGTKMAGPSASQAYFDLFGEPCDNSTQACAISVTGTLIAECPAYSTSACPFSKIFSVHYEVQVVGLFTTRMAARNNENKPYVRIAVDQHQSGYGVTVVN